MKQLLYLLFLFILVVSCRQKQENAEALFTLLAPSQTHVTFSNDLTEDEDFNMIEYLYFNNGAGVAAGDINNDGLIDLFFTSSQNGNKLYLNKGNLAFEDITLEAGVSGEGNWTTGVTMADVNGDDLLDIYVCHVGNYKAFRGRNQLFINQGNLRFKEQAQEYGLDFEGFSTQAAFFDYDMDGDLDMYLLNHSVHTSRSYGMSDLRFEKDERAGDKLYRNDVKDGKPWFHDVTQESGIYSSQIGYGLGVNINDINNDGYPDIFVSNDFHENDYFYINQQNGTFKDKMTEMFAHTSRSSMGDDVADFNNDGLLDVVVLDMLPDQEKIRKQSGGEDDYELFQLKLNKGYHYQFVRNTLQLNLGGGQFSEIGRLAGIYSTDWSWSPLFCDVDNDGWKDLFISNGIYRRANDLDYIQFLTGGNKYMPVKDNSQLSDKELYEKMPLFANVNYIFKNNADLTFSNMAKEWGFHEKSYSNGATYADLDNDGDLDLIVNNINEPAFIYQNNSEKLPNHHFLSINLKGKDLNPKGVGTRATVFKDGKQQVVEQFATRGFLSATTDALHFGLGAATTIDSLMVRWPDKTEQLIKNLTTNQRITLEQENAKKTALGNTMQVDFPKFFTSTHLAGLQFTHKEDSYDELRFNQLIPKSLSAEGPALAVGDVNNDGLDDLFIGGAKGQAAAIFIQQPDGSFNSPDVPQFVQDRFTEDVDAAFFDANGDGYSDLYIVRGGNESLIGDPFLADRLLINDGKRRFMNSDRGALPYMAYNGSCVRPCDFDNDGDLDLFIGSRSIPGAYGLSADQFLLENDGKGVFKMVTSERMKGQKMTGMVTDACWTDYDNDGDQDLVTVGEWMNVSIFQNNKGYFTDVTEDAGLSQTSGWWNCIRTADLDNDGDLDLIGGNQGLNSIFTASSSEPVEMYINDFDNNGTIEPIICSYINGISYPVASFDELSGQIKGLKEKYPQYADFGGKTMEDIFGKEMLDRSVTKTAVLLESCVFLNNNGTFEKKELPVEAQFSPVRDILTIDLNKDLNPDLLMVGNDYRVRPSLGRYDAAFGWCFLADSIDHYRTLLPAESGLKTSGDARKIRLIEVSGEKYVVVAGNNEEVQIFLLQEKK